MSRAEALIYILPVAALVIVGVVVLVGGWFERWWKGK